MGKWGDVQDRKRVSQMRVQNTWQILRLASSWLCLHSLLKEGFPATAASVLVMHLGSGVRDVWVQVFASWVILGEWFNLIKP